MPQLAMIYCRVSDQKQVTDGHGLSSQETRCREYARIRGYDVIDVFHEEGITGALMDRPRIREMLAMLRLYKQERIVVIIDDISRLARDILTHIHLRDTIIDAGGKLESPSVQFGETADERYMEHMLALTAGHQRDKNTEQVKNRMRARVQNGYWCFFPPPGYKYKKVDGHGKLMVRDEPMTSVMTEALEGFASGKFQTQGEVRLFLERSPHFTKKDRKGNVHFSRVKEMLGNILYAGYLDKPDWGIHLQEGKHEALISFDTYRKNQERLKEKAKAPARKDISADFPLRGFVNCGDCGSHMSAGWTKGRSAKYPYYHCINKACSAYKKSIRRDVIEGDFEALLSACKPSKEIFFAAAAIFTDLWNKKRQTLASEADAIRRQVMLIERKSEQMLERIIAAENPTLITAYETKLRTLEEEKVTLQENAAASGRPLASFEDTFRTAFAFLSNPQKLWASGRMEHQRTVPKLVFGEKLNYCRKEGFRTAAKSLPFLALEHFTNGNYEMVEDSGVEPLTS